MAVQTAGMVNFSVTDEGHLLCTYTGNEAPDYYINDARASMPKHLTEGGTIYAYH